MAKKSTVKPSSAAATTGGDAGDLKAQIHDHSAFFDRLVELIPARFYLPADDDKPWYQGLSKAAKAAAKAESRRNLKKARRDRLDPSKSATTLDLLQKNINAAKNPSDDETDDPSGREPDSVASDDRSVTYEELRQRLHRRIEELRAGRNTRPEGQERRELEGRKRKGKKGGEGKRKRDDGDGGGDERGVKGKKGKVEKANSGGDLADIAFGKVKLDGGDRKGKKKMSKQHELAMAKRLEEAKKDPEKEGVLKKLSWKAAVDRAAGVKVHDNPKLLSKSMQREKQKQKKSALKWKDRMETVEKGKADKQKTRKDNIKERIHQKKMRRIEKREKKLMRPGFEGRKEGYIN